MDRKQESQGGVLRAASERKNAQGSQCAQAGDLRSEDGVAALSKDVLAALDREFHEHFREAPYYSSGRDWADYAPAYRYGYATRGDDPQRVFVEMEAQLARGWDAAKGTSRLCWAEARGAVQDAWRSIDSAGHVARRHLGPEH